MLANQVYKYESTVDSTQSTAHVIWLCRSREMSKFQLLFKDNFSRLHVSTYILIYISCHLVISFLEKYQNFDWTWKKSDMYTYSPTSSLVG